MGIVERAIKWYRQESVLVGVVLTAGSGLYEAFSTHLTSGQVSAITAFVGAVMGLLARSQVTPVANIAPRVIVPQPPYQPGA